MVLDLLIAAGIGAIYGYAKKGRQDKGQLFKTGVLWGLVISLILAAIGYLLDSSFLLTGGDALRIVIGVVLLIAAFVGGVFLGDWLEHR